LTKNTRFAAVTLIRFATEIYDFKRYNDIFEFRCIVLPSLGYFLVENYVRMIE